MHGADRLAIIEALKAMPDAVEAEIDGLSEAELRFRRAANEWSIKEVVGHMLDGAEIWGKRLYQVWAQNDPLFAPYDQEAQLRERNYQDADISEVLREIKEARLETIELLAHAVDWTRLGQWPGVGRRSLKQLAQAVIEGENAHLEQIRSLKAAAQAKNPAGT